MQPLITNLTGNTKIIPVIVIEDQADALPLANCLVANGLPVLEVTLRTQAGLSAIEVIAREVEGAVVGAGSVLTPGQLDQVIKAGAAFGVSPGYSPDLLAALKETELPFLPGGGTVSEVMHLREAGFVEQKSFPANIVGGIDYLKAVAGPVGDVSFCPTGGVKPENAQDYLTLENVFAVGGSWIAPLDLVRAKDWIEIGNRAKIARQIQEKTVRLI